MNPCCNIYDRLQSIINPWEGKGLSAGVKGAVGVLEVYAQPRLGQGWKERKGKS